MENILIFLVLMSLQISVNSWYALEYRNSSLQPEDECLSVDVNIGKMHVGEFRNLDDCVLAVCGDKGILYLGCTEVEASANCTLAEGNNTLPHPHCCTKCKEDIH